MRVTSIVGARTHCLEGLVVRSQPRPRRAGTRREAAAPRAGLPLLAQHHARLRPRGPRRGISTLLAVPIMVGTRARGVLYCGSWAQSPVGERRDAARVCGGGGTGDRTPCARRGRAPARGDAAPSEASLMPSRRRARELRESYAELRSIAAAVDDAELRARLATLERRLAALSHDAGCRHSRPTCASHPARSDVLACAALGATNAEIATTLDLKEGTVKSYLQAAMAKLDASTRHAAVAEPAGPACCREAPNNRAPKFGNVAHFGAGCRNAPIFAQVSEFRAMRNGHQCVIQRRIVTCMARRIVHQLVDDLDGTILEVGEGETVLFSLDGVATRSTSPTTMPRAARRPRPLCRRSAIDLVPRFEQLRRRRRRAGAAAPGSRTTAPSAHGRRTTDTRSRSGAGFRHPFSKRTKPRTDRRDRRLRRSS